MNFPFHSNIKGKIERDEMFVLAQTSKKFELQLVRLKGNTREIFIRYLSSKNVLLSANLLFSVYPI